MGMYQNENANAAPAWKKRRFIASVLILIALILGPFLCQSGLFPPKVVTEECPFCRLYAGDGLALIDTQTGATDLVDIWLHGSSGPEEPGDWKTQLRNGDHSTFSFMSVGDGIELTHMGGTQLIFTPEEVNTTAYFCEAHRSLATAPYVLVDRKHLDALDVYPIYPGEEFHFRHYTVFVYENELECMILIESDLFEEEVAQWKIEQESRQTDKS